MDLIVILLLILVVLILNNNNYEGFEDCEYRGQRKGSMCKEKWGLRNCYPWKPMEKFNQILSSKKFKEVKGYYSNPYSYDLGYETDETDPKGVNSTFFS